MSFWGTVMMIELASLAVMAVAYLFAVRKHDMGLIDLGWTGGLGLAGVIAALSLGGAPWRCALLAILLGAWALRLGYHILMHRVVGHEEDGRYRMLREYWGSRTVVYMPLFFLAESFLIPLFAIPVMVAMQSPEAGVTWLDIAGVLVWLVAVCGESLADGQLEKFRSVPANRGTTCREGLWRYSRHPNYFFEWVHWWAYVVMAIGLAGFALTLIGPVVMLVFLFKVTGIPHTERRAAASRGDDYREYQETTSVFIPWFPRKAV